MVLVMDRRGNYAVYNNGKFTGYMIYRDNGDLWPTSIYYRGEYLARTGSVKEAREFIQSR